MRHRLIILKCFSAFSSEKFNDFLGIHHEICQQSVNWCTVCGGSDWKTWRKIANSVRLIYLTITKTITTTTTTTIPIKFCNCVYLVALIFFLQSPVLPYLGALPHTHTIHPNCSHHTNNKNFFFFVASTNWN